MSCKVGGLGITEENKIYTLIDAHQISGSRVSRINVKTGDVLVASGCYTNGKNLGDFGYTNYNLLCQHIIDWTNSTADIVRVDMDKNASSGDDQFNMRNTLIPLTTDEFNKLFPIDSLTFKDYKCRCYYVISDGVLVTNGTNIADNAIKVLYQYRKQKISKVLSYGTKNQNTYTASSDRVYMTTHISNGTSDDYINFIKKLSRSYVDSIKNVTNKKIIVFLNSFNTSTDLPIRIEDSSGHIIYDDMHTLVGWQFSPFNGVGPVFVLHPGDVLRSMNTAYRDQYPFASGNITYLVLDPDRWD